MAGWGTKRATRRLRSSATLSALAALAALATLLGGTMLAGGCGGSDGGGAQGSATPSGTSAGDTSGDTSPSASPAETASPAADLVWPTTYRDCCLNGLSPVSGPGAKKVAWKSTLGCESAGFTVLDAAGRVVFGGKKKLAAFDPATGKAVWSRAVSGECRQHAFARADGTVIVSAGKKVFCVGADGKDLWAYEMPTPADAPTISPEGIIYAGSEGGTLVALSPEGEELWTAKASDNIHSPSIGPDGTLYCGGAPLVLYAFSPDGQKLWDMWPEGELPSYDEMYPWVNCVQSPSIAADGTLFAGSQVMPGIDKSGAQIPNYKIPEHGSLYAITPDGTKVIWSHTCKSFATMTPTIAADGTLYAGTSAFKVIALRPDGKVVWEFQTATNDCPFVYSPPIGEDGLLYAATSSGKLYCITPQGKQKWLYDSGKPWLPGHSSNNLTPPCIAADGTLYTAQFDGTVLAFE